MGCSIISIMDSTAIPRMGIAFGIRHGSYFIAQERATVLHRSLLWVLVKDRAPFKRVLRVKTHYGSYNKRS